jgi:hypothetical protein
VFDGYALDPNEPYPSERAIALAIEMLDDDEGATGFWWSARTWWTPE